MCVAIHLSDSTVTGCKVGCVREVVLRCSRDSSPPFRTWLLSIDFATLDPRLDSSTPVQAGTAEVLHCDMEGTILTATGNIDGGCTQTSIAGGD